MFSQGAGQATASSAAAQAFRRRRRQIAPGPPGAPQTVLRDRAAPVVRISGFEGARRSKCALTGCGPEREVSHARQPLEPHLRQHV